MAIYRVHKTTDYTVMSNEHLRNKEMSLKAKGLLSVMLSLPTNWDYTEQGLASLSKDGRDNTRVALKELERFGYLIRTRNRDEKGRLTDTVYDIFENPQMENSTDGKTNVGIANIGRTNVGISTQLNTNKSNKEELNTDLLKNTQKKKYGEFQNVLLTDEEVEKLKANLPDWEKWIETLSHGIALKGYKYKSHYLAILKWSKSDKSNEKEVSFDVELAERQARENRVDFGTKKNKRKRGKDNDTKTENIEVSE